MSARKHPVSPGADRGSEEVLTTLREHLSDEDAEMLAGRIETSERDEEYAMDWQVIKRRVLDGPPRS